MTPDMADSVRKKATHRYYPQTCKLLVNNVTILLVQAFGSMYEHVITKEALKIQRSENPGI